MADIFATKPLCARTNSHGWVRTEVGSLKIDWMYGHAAPDAVLELLSCQCKI